MVLTWISHLLLQKRDATEPTTSASQRSARLVLGRLFEAEKPQASYCEPNCQKPATWCWFAVNGENQRELFAFPVSGSVGKAL